MLFHHIICWIKGILQLFVFNYLVYEYSFECPIVKRKAIHNQSVYERNEASIFISFGDDSIKLTLSVKTVKITRLNNAIVWKQANSKTGE